MLIDTSADEAKRTVTRVEILAAVRTAFDGTGATKADLLATAEAAEARPETIAALRRLPEATEFRQPRELWAYFPDMPVN